MKLDNWVNTASPWASRCWTIRGLLARVREVVDDVVAHSSLREQIDSAGVTVHEKAGAARFADPHTIVTETGLQSSG